MTSDWLVSLQLFLGPPTGKKLSGLAFQFGDENGAGHRGFAGISGWGWLNHGTDCIARDCTHIYDGDWLFTAAGTGTTVAVWLFGSALGVMGVLRRKVTG